MTSRITFLVLALFWMTMTYLLWRSEYVGDNHVGSSVPVELVWRRILTAPDTSRLEIRHNGKKVGYCQWSSNVGQEMTAGKILGDDAPPESFTGKVTSYRLDLEGNVALPDTAGRMRFDCELRLSTNQAWQELDLKFNQKPVLWEIHSHASEQNIHLITQQGHARSERIFKFADLQNPQSLIEEFAMPGPLGLLGSLNPAARSPAPAPLTLGLDWKARNDWIPIGHTSVRAYRLEASVLERYRMLIIVSRVGEILEVELPDGWELINDQLITL